MAPYGWEVETKKATTIVVSWSVKGAEKLARHGWALDLAEYSSSSIANSPIARIYDYSKLAHKDISEALNGNFYSNSIEVADALTEDLIFYLSPEVRGSSLIEKINNLVTGLISEECKDFSKKESYIYNTLMEAFSLYKRIPRDAGAYCRASLNWIGDLRRAADGSIIDASIDMDEFGWWFRIKLWAKGIIYGYNTNEMRDKSVNAEELFKTAQEEYSKGLYISAKRDADEANRLKREVLEFSNSMKMRRFKFFG